MWATLDPLADRMFNLPAADAGSLIVMKPGYGCAQACLEKMAAGGTFRESWIRNMTGMKWKAVKQEESSP